MNARDILTYGQQTVVDTCQGLSEEQWRTSGACGFWSPKDIVAHLTSYEWVLAEILGNMAGAGPTPYLDSFRDVNARFNDAQVAARRDKGVDDVVAEFQLAHARVMVAVDSVSADALRQPGTLPWYGLSYAVDDFIVYASYGHKREHSAQIAAFRDRLVV